MGIETLWVKGLHLITPDFFEEVLLSVGGDTALVGDLLVYDSLAAGTLKANDPATHKMVKLAAALGADAQADKEFLGWHGQLIKPSETPERSAGVDWTSDTALLDGQQVIMLKRGAFGVVTKMIYTDASDDLLTGIGLSLSATAGEVQKTVNAFTDGTPTVVELATALLSQVMEFVGHADSVMEDPNPGQSGVDVMWGST
jgi:hypothetical protein